MRFSLYFDGFNLFLFFLEIIKFWKKFFGDFGRDKNKKPFLRRFGRGGEDRTPINGFGDRYATIVPHP